MLLQKELYGLKQAPKLWHDKWRRVMHELGLTSPRCDECVYLREIVWLLLHEDDIIIIGQELFDVEEVETEHARHLEVKDMGELRLLLGVAFKQDVFGASLSQFHYIMQLLERFGMQECKAVSTPMICGSKGTEGDD